MTTKVKRTHRVTPGRPINPAEHFCHIEDLMRSGKTRPLFLVLVQREYSQLPNRSVTTFTIRGLTRDSRGHKATAGFFPEKQVFSGVLPRRAGGTTSVQLAIR